VYVCLFASIYVNQICYRIEQTLMTGLHENLCFMKVGNFWNDWQQLFIEYCTVQLI
jgi:hypothetical protein